MNFELKGSFEDLPIKTSTIISPLSRQLNIYCHGSYDFADGHDGFYTSFFQKAAQQNLSSFVQFTTSRRDSYYQNQIFEAFEGKNMEHEIKDVNRVVRWSLDAVEKGIFGEVDQIGLIGLSLGGTIASIIAGQQSKITKLMLISSGCRTKNGSLSLLKEYPNPEKIKSLVANWRGKLTHVSPENDQVVPVEYQTELYDAFVSANKKRFIIPGADHVHSSTKPQLSTIVERYLGD